MLKQLRYFQSVVRLNSFSEAAEENFISQSAISQQIQALERELADTAGGGSAGGTDRVQIRKSDAVAQQRARTQQAVRPR